MHRCSDSLQLLVRAVWSKVLDFILAKIDDASLINDSTTYNNQSKTIKTSSLFSQPNKPGHFRIIIQKHKQIAVNFHPDNLNSTLKS